MLVVMEPVWRVKTFPLHSSFPRLFFSPSLLPSLYPLSFSHAPPRFFPRPLFGSISFWTPPFFRPRPESSVAILFFSGRKECLGYCFGENLFIETLFPFAYFLLLLLLLLFFFLVLLLLFLFLVLLLLFLFRRRRGQRRRRQRRG